jgi:hypothetical protein
MQVIFKFINQHPVLQLVRSAQHESLHRVTSVLSAVYPTSVG